MSYVKPSELMRMRSHGELSRLELTAIQNMMGRGLKTTIDDRAIYFQNGGDGPAARIKRFKEVAVVFTKNCDGDEKVQQYLSGLVAAGYRPHTSKYEA